MNSNCLRFKRSIQTCHQGIFSALLSIPDWNRFLLGDVNDGSISLWEASSFEKLDHIKAHQDCVTVFCFIKNKNLLISASRDTTIQVRRISPEKFGEVLAVLEGHANVVRSIVYVEKYEFILSAGEDPDIKIWDIKTLELKDKIQTFRGGIGLSMIVLQNENLVGVGFTDGFIDIYSLRSKKAVWKIYSGKKDFYFNSLYITKNRLLISIVENDCIKIWSLAGKKPKLLREIQHEGINFVSNFVLLEDKKRLIVPVHRRFLLSLNIYNGKSLGEISTKSSISFVLYIESLHFIVGGYRKTNILSVMEYKPNDNH